MELGSRKTGFFSGLVPIGKKDVGNTATRKFSLPHLTYSQLLFLT